MTTKTIIATAVASSLITPDVLPEEQCPLVNFDDMKSSLHSALCGLDERALARDVALLGQHQELVAKVVALDPAGVSETIATIQSFIASVDTDEDGKIDGLAALIDAVNTLTPRVTELERRANLTDEQILQLGQQQNTTAAATQANAQAIADLAIREDKEGIDEAKAAEIAAAAICSTVLKPLADAAQSFADDIAAIDCGVAGNAAFMTALTDGTAYVAPTAGEAEGGDTAGAAASI